MKTIKIFGAVVFIIMLLVQAGCSEDPLSPTEEKPIEALAAAEIGSEGGTVATDDVSITIPPGALGEKHNIAIYDIADDGAFGENTVSSSFKISGLPNDYTKPIKIKMKYTGELSGLSFIAMGSYQFDKMSGDSSIVYDMISASDSSGYLVSELPVLQFNLSKNTSVVSDDPEFDRWIHAATAYNRMRTENFELNYPNTLSSEASNIGTILEDVYSIVLNDLGFSYKKGNERWQVTVTIQNKVVTGILATSSPGLNISRDLLRLSKYGDIKIALGKQLIDQGIYNYYKPLPEYEIKAGYLWLQRAIKTWSEELFTDDPNYKRPIDFPPNAMAPFNGMRAGAGGDYEKIIFNNHGYGMSSMIKYLVDDTRFGIGGILKTYQDISQGVDPIAALIKNMDAMVADWWPDFINTYMSGDIYDVPNDYFLDNTKLEWNINDENDTLKIFAASDPAVKFYPDLSAKLFKINLINPELVSAQNMLLSMKGPVTEGGLSLVVFGVQNGEQVYLGTASAQDFEIPNLKEYYDNNMRQFLVVLVNSLGGSPFLSESDIDLTIKVSKQKEVADIPDISKVNRCTIKLMVLADEFTETKDGEQSNKITNVTLESKIIEGSFTGNTFTGTYSTTLIGGTTIEETVTVTVNDQHNIITDVSWSSLKEYDTSYRGVEKTEKGFSGAEIPMFSYSSYSNTIHFMFTGENACNYITNAISREENLFSIKLRSIQSYTCNEHSYVSVLFQQGY